MCLRGRWVKLGWARDPMQRASDGFWENSHPTDRFGKLCPPHCKLIGLWEGTKEEENALQEQFNEGILKKGDVHNEFYPIEEWPKIYRDLMTHHKNRCRSRSTTHRHQDAKKLGRSAAAGASNSVSLPKRPSRRRRTGNDTGRCTSTSELSLPRSVLQGRRPGNARTRRDGRLAQINRAGIGGARGPGL